MEPAAPYPDLHAHLRDELWRVWLRVEFQIRNRWEMGILPRVADDATIGIWTPDNLAGLFRAAHGDYIGGERAAPATDAGATPVLEAFVHHSRTMSARIHATLDAGLRLPLCDLARCFDLNPRQAAALTFALMPEIDPNLLAAYRYLSHDPSCRGLDARLLALLVYDTPESRAQLSRDLSPVSPLLFFRLLEQEEGSINDSMLYRRLRPAARLVQMLTGDADELDPQLAELAELRSDPPPGLFPDALLAQAEAALRGGDLLLVVQGVSGVGKRLLCQHAAARRGKRTLMIHGRGIAALDPRSARPMVRSLLREARLLGAIPVIPDVDDVATGEADRDELPGFVTTLCNEHKGPIALTVRRERMPRMEVRPVVQLTLDIPSLTERSTLWRQQLPSLSEADADALSERFAAPGGVIVAAGRAAAATRLDDQLPDVAALDHAVRAQLHDRILRLGRKLATPFELADLIVDEDVSETLREIISAVRQRRQVRERWGFRGAQGVSVLFSGDPGVGKTMSATVLARQLDLAIYEVDLSRVVSKWIGETEKNLSDVFDAAEPGHVVLLFNEADSLFGKRTSDVQSANDRYANLETNYLLQRLERFGGLAILTTNLAKAIDPAFRRR
ncbi:MAG: AAA family ATPase, partial [Myxococcales bacterium]|nr:AAA family ATPase [Myxococcales bacterium]